MFYGREDQIERFSSLWRKGVPSFVVIRGRRRIGKSTLVKEFARRSGGVFLKFEGLAPDEYMTNSKQLSEFRNQLSVQLNKMIPRIKDWSDAFRELDQFLGDDRQRKIVLFDEVSWMGGYDRSFPAKLKIAWDNLFHERKNLVVFVCGSVSTWIHRNILKSRGFVGRISLDTVVDELPLNECVKFWGDRANRLDEKEILDVLSVTGGVPRYLEEVDPALSAEENIRRLCFRPDGYLFREFNELFNDIVSRSAATKRNVLEALAEGPLSGTELAAKLSIARNGRLSDLLDELETAGFIAKADGINPETGKRARIDRYRLRDNYTRFFLKYVSRRAPEIIAGSYSFISLDMLPEWNSIMGLQFENLVLNNLRPLISRLGLDGKIILSAAPFRSSHSSRGGVQIDLLIQTESTAIIVEIKRKRELGIEVAEELRRKITCLKVRRGVSIRTALVYSGSPTRQLIASDVIDQSVPIAELYRRTMGS